MDLRSIVTFYLLVLMFSCVFLQSMCDGESTVLFVDGPNHRYIRDQKSGGGQKIDMMTTSEIASTISVLLGFAPSSSMSAESSIKLNELLVPNPFDKPLAVLVLEVKGAGAPPLSTGHPDFVSVSSFNHKVLGSNSAEIKLSDEDDISVISINEPFSCVTCLNKEFADLADLLGGSYVGSIESMDGELNIPLTSGSSFKLHVSKQADLSFCSGLASLVHGVKKAIQMHEDCAVGIKCPAELLSGVFTGIKALSEYGPEMAEQGHEVLQTTIYNLFTLLQKECKGKIVAVVVFSELSSADSVSVISLKYPTRSISRWLEEGSASNVTRVNIAEVLLVRTTLAWITGIILLVATYIGAYLLLYMPITKDTLLYSNVKLD